MKKWEKFERDSAKFIKDNYANEFNIDVKTIGGSDSNLNDIQIYKNSSLILNVESKANEAQCGQFVVTIDSNNNFKYSPRNFTPINGFTNLIMNELNNSDIYLESTYKYVDVDIPNRVAVGWVTEYYKSKNVEFFISQYNGNKILIHIDNLKDYFDITCKIRPKGSGSKDVPRKNVDIFHKGINMLHPEYNISRDQLHYEQRKLVFNSPYTLFNESKNKITFKLNGVFYRFQIENMGDSTYYVRSLSTTRNPTVIFSLISISDQQEKDLECFKNKLIHS